MWRGRSLKFWKGRSQKFWELEVVYFTSDSATLDGVTIDYIDTQDFRVVTTLCKILHSLRQDILRPVLTIGRQVSFENETRPETFETETPKNGSRDY